MQNFPNYWFDIMVIHETFAPCSDYSVGMINALRIFPGLVLSSMCGVDTGGTFRLGSWLKFPKVSVFSEE